MQLTVTTTDSRKTVLRSKDRTFQSRGQTQTCQKLVARSATLLNFLTSRQLEPARSQRKTQVFFRVKSAKKHLLLVNFNHGRWMIFHSLLIADQKTKDLPSIGTCPKKDSVQKDRNLLLLDVGKLALQEKQPMENSLRFRTSSLAAKHTRISSEKNSFHQREQSQLAEKHLIIVI